MLSIHRIPGPKPTVVFIAAAAMAAAAQDSDSALTRFGFDGFEARMALEAGHLVNGEFQRAGSDARPMSMVPMNRNIVFLDQDASYGEDWDFNAGFMGVMWWPFTPEAGPPGTRTVRVESRVSRLKARRNFGEGKPAYLEFGYFPYKYNPDAWNLGEYLYRSGTYPGVINTTDGVQLMSSPAYYAYGARFHWDMAGGLLAHDVNLFSEPAVDPIGDITPAYELSLKTSILEVGAGAAWNRGFSYRPSRLEPKDQANLYVQWKGDATTPAYTGPFEGAPDAVLTGAVPVDTLHIWTHKGVKVMARAALDLGFLLPEDKRSPGDLRIYAEAAVLGWADQPYYYTNRSRRMPVMAGLNVPTFGLLDLLAFQAEHYNAEFNSTYNLYINGLPIWKVEDFATKDAQHYKPNPWRWSMHGRKQINRLANLNFQVASDHLRMRDLLTLPTEYEMTQKPGNWYYLLRLDVGI
jgi:hypothetical protein